MNLSIITHISLVIILSLFHQTISSSGLENISDDDLVHSIKTNEQLVVLFAKRNCDDCDNYENHLINLQDDFRETLNCQIVKVINSQMLRLYSPTKEPAIVYFRHGVPLLYDGPIDEDVIYMRFNDNRLPLVKELTDETFEHLTQASTGSTTGNWFIFFYTQNCIECQRLTGVLEAVAAELKNRVNLARVNKDGLGSGTAKRFKITKSPELIFIRQGKFYRYEIGKFDIKSMTTFALDWYKNARAEKIAVPESPFDQLVGWSVEQLKMIIPTIQLIINEYPYLVLFISFGFGLTLLTALIAICFASRKKQDTTDKTKKKDT